MKPTRPNRYWAIVPPGTTDEYAAGYDGNCFATRHEAERAVRSLRRLGGEWDVPWEVRRFDGPAS